MTPAEEERFCERKRDGEKKKEKDRQEASVGASAEMSNRKNQARK